MLSAVFVVLLVMLSGVCMAQPSSAKNPDVRFAVSTNVADYVNLLTPNVDVQYAVGRRVTAQIGVKYNNWSFNHRTENEMKNRQQTYYAGARWWPWYTYSGWWLGGAAQYQEYDRGGVFTKDSEAGNAFGLVLSGGYSIQIAKWLNFDMGIGFWGGRTEYVLYACPNCGKKVDEGKKFFVLPNEARVALQFIF